ncbi:MAG: glycosyltransferase [Eubacterium sp.]|nr:glycosyltransferase [Eubacterium sp.]
MASDYAVVVVTYNRLALLQECLEQVERQTLPPRKIIVVDNASTDGTAAYLRECEREKACYQIITCAENTGGAGGFERGMRAAEREDVTCLLMIDDDAILAVDYMEKIMEARRHYPAYRAYAGMVMTADRIDTYHRKNIIRPGLLQRNCPEECYTDRHAGAPFACDVASFCGMVVDRALVNRVGLPCGAYFIWNDDTEYSLRLNRYTRFLVIPEAQLDHKTTAYVKKYPHRRYDWREYYGIRNRLLYVRKHGNMLDRVVNRVDMFCHIVLRNWLFGIVNMDGYDWKYEKRLVREAYRDARLPEALPKDVRVAEKYI